MLIPTLEHHVLLLTRRLRRRPEKSLARVTNLLYSLSHCLSTRNFATLTVSFQQLDSFAELAVLTQAY